VPAASLSMLRPIPHARVLALLVLGLVVLTTGLAPALGTPTAERTVMAGRAHAAQAEEEPSCPPAGLTSVPNGQLRMPYGAKPGATRLLVAVMSGGDGDADDYLKLGAAANQQGIAVLYPTGRAGSMWQIADYFGTSDVQLVSDLLDRVLATGCFDQNRISITGVSNGAGFAVRMACKLPSRFAAVVAVAAGFRALDACPATRASFLAIHGSADIVVPFNGRPPDYKGNVERYTADWARRDGCSTSPWSYRPRHYVTRFVFDRCASGMKVGILLLAGTDHGWPGAPPPFPKRNPSGVDGNLEVLRFVRHAVRPA
jgi:polyhydroxybutyrate depolymerase